jgi:hypothetical protein
MTKRLASGAALPGWADAGWSLSMANQGEARILLCHAKKVKARVKELRNEQ